ncbi:hypothetical protein BO78DRAFT_288884, partial [Aspergillus sclerotiicarbonarius CBS 121057]
FLFMELRRHEGGCEWARWEWGYDDDVKEIDGFVVWKVSELDKYDEALEKMEKDQTLIDSGDMTKEEFIANALSE